MVKALKYLFFILLLCVVAFAIWKFSGFFKGPKLNVIEKSEVIIERLEKVNKLVTVDAYFSELKDYKDFYYYDISPFRKKAIIRIKAKVSVGYDFGAIKLEMDETNKVVRILGFPEPQILSIDHDLDYYDLSEGMFNSFSRDDYNKLNKESKEFIRKTAMVSDVFNEAELQKVELLKMFEWVANSAGWRLQVINMDGREADLSEESEESDDAEF